MRLRELQEKDAPLMLEWMHDDSVVEYMKTDFHSKTIGDCLSFIANAQNDPGNLHLAIADEQDEYMGTISLKNIRNGHAEFGITIRALAMGKGLAESAMTKILKKGFTEKELSDIYWCVDPENKRAVRFYDKNKYPRILSHPADAEGYTENELEQFLWYQVDRQEAAARGLL